MLLGLLIALANEHFGGHAHQFGVSAQLLRFASDAKYSDQALIEQQRQVDPRLHALQMHGGLRVDLDHATVGQHQLRAFVTGVDALRFTAAEDQPLAVHDVDVVGQNGHRPVDDILGQVVIKFEHEAYSWKSWGFGCSPAQALGVIAVLRHKDIRQWVTETLHAVTLPSHRKKS
ncbi:hypothetical protein D3C81_1669830 [compost metagenome]